MKKIINMQRIYSFQNTHSILYVIATPIGNLKEFSPRALESITQSDFVACEDTRTTGKLLNEFGISKPFIACHEHNEEQASNKIIDLLLQGKIISLTSDAGYPGISDPGSRLIKKAIENHIPVSIVNGSCAFLPGLIASGLNTDHFYFHGFLKSKSSERRKELEHIKSYEMTIIFYEAPHRIKETLKDIYDIFGNRKISIAREISKIYEEYIRGTLEEVLQIDEISLKGEMVLVLEGNNLNHKTISQDELIKIINKRLKDKTISKKDLSRELAEIYNLKKNEVYQLIINCDK